MIPPMPPIFHSATSDRLQRSGKQAQLEISSRRQEPSHALYSYPSSNPGPSAQPRTTLSQRFRRAIQQGDLPSAQRIAARAFELQFLPRPSPYDTYEATSETSPLPLKASLRAAEAQRPSSSHPFDVRNIGPVSDRSPTHTKHHHHHRKYSLAIHHDPHPDESDPSLILAIKHNADVELIRWLIEMGHEQRSPSLDADGNTILHLATLYDRSDIIYAYSTYTSAHVASTISDLIDAETHHDRRTALHLACIKGYDDVARQLLDLGADVDVQDKAGNTALHFASAWGHTSLVQALIERGCQLAVKNNEGSTAVDYAFSHSVKAALETMGRVRHESRKNRRRAPAATSALAAQAGEEGSLGERNARMRPFSSFLSRNGSNSGRNRSTTSTPVRMTFADEGSELYDDWDPERTFAQPGQDLTPNKRGVGALSSPPVQRVASPNFSTPARTSIDLYSEVLNHQSPSGTPQMKDMRQLAQSPPEQGSRGLFPQNELEMRRQLSPHMVGLRRSPSPGGAVGSASADKVRMQDAAAMSLFRSTTPQPSVPGRIDTPPLGLGGGMRSESPAFMLTRKGGVRSPPVEAGALKGIGDARDGRGSDAPPLVAPIATVPRVVHEADEAYDERQGRNMVSQAESAAGGRRDSSPSTPRPDDRDTFS